MKFNKMSPHKTTTYLSVTLWLLWVLSILHGLGCASGQSEIEMQSELYQPLHPYQSLQIVPPGDSHFATLTLERPINFYSEKFSEVFINTNGILTFNIEFPEYINQPFPLEYASIAPFYTNVDTTVNSGETSISAFLSQEPQHLQRASELVQFAFTDRPDFEATQLLVATWRDVGYYNQQTDRLNTFQAIIIANDEETYVQFIYPSGGLNWLQGETGDLGLPDIRAQAGFVAEDGRYFNLEGSGTDQARFLSENTNVGVAGVWLYRVGPTDYVQNVMRPTNEISLTEPPREMQTCAEGSHRHCHTQATCMDKRYGFCCVCRDEYYGNGDVCIKSNYPIRVLGSLSGEINGHVIEQRSKLQSYVVMSDARSYTAVNPIGADLGSELRLALPIITTIGWLFAKPMNGALNGYQLTGGYLTHSARLQFDSGEQLWVNQTFEGLNYWDQLSAHIQLYGEVPHINPSAKLHMADYIDEYKFVSPTEVRSIYAHTLEVSNENRVINFQVDQTIHFERCLLDDEPSPTGSTVLQKASKIVLDYTERDQALRTSILTKIGVDAESNACTDGTAICGPNTVCVPYEDTYRCDCLFGYGPERFDNGVELCVDLNECELGTHVCDDNAICSNNEGGFTCVCFEGYEGNGYHCLRNETADNMESSTPGYIMNTINVDDEDEAQNELVLSASASASTTLPNYPQHDECARCSHDADCFEGRCECREREGFRGDGYTCTNICGHDEAFEHGRCVPILFDDHEVTPICNFFGECSCPEGYEFMEDVRLCRYAGHGYEPELKSDELIPCDVDANCHINASCEWYEHEMRHICTCNPGFRGDGYTCEPIDESCALRPDICDSHATCNYNEALGKSQCQCKSGYEGDGFRCQLAPDCRDDVHCGSNAYCDMGVCQCVPGYERNPIDMCVPAGRCGAVSCGENALCRWDSIQSVQYCDCMEGYEGDALDGCKSIPVPCNVRNNCGVHATCEPTEDPAHYECQCNAGYHGDGYVCIEEKNCLNDPYMCDMNAKCLSTNSGLVCVCNQGFYGNGSVCVERQQHESGFLLVSQGVVIVRVPLNGKNVRPISVASMAIGLDKDCVEGRLYWGDISAKKIVSARYDGSDLRPFITEDIESPEGIAIDSISRRLYWTDSVKDTIEVASLDDPTMRAIIVNKQLVNPRGIAIDPYREKLYWSDWDRESPKIEMSDLDGTGRELLLGKDSVTLPNSLVVVQSTGELCYADAGTKKVECIDSHTKQLRTISNELTYPFGLAFTHDHFYWTDWTTKKLESVDTFGKRQKGMQTPFFGSHKMYGMTAIEDNCPQMDSPCTINNGGCTDARICLVNRKAPSGKSCKCTTNSQSCPMPLYGVAF